MFNVTQSLNRELFLVIVAKLWDKWTTKQVPVANARCDGITSPSLNANTM